MRGRGVGPTIANGPKRRTALGDRANDIEQIARRTRQTIQATDNQHVTLIEHREQAR
jgi:hypothetical protein